MNAQKLLNQHKIKATRQRLALLEYFINTQKSILFYELENKFFEQIDRVTLYRIIKKYIEHGILCKFKDSKGRMNYVLHCEQQTHHNHPHFKCNTCSEVSHLPELPKEYLAKLSDLEINHIEVTAEGTCKKCKKGNDT
jgi:Fur family transcriptional regulator, ferric uptake regulator